MKKALGNSKLTNKGQHLGENKAVSKRQGVPQAAPGPVQRTRQAGQHARVRGTGHGQGGPAQSQCGRGRQGQRGGQKTRLVTEGLEAC